MYNTGIGLVRKHATTGTLSQTTDARQRARSSAGTTARAAMQPRQTSARPSVETASKLPAKNAMTTTATTTTVAAALASLKRATAV